MPQDFTNETDARIVIDDLLRQAGCNLSDKSMVLTEVTTHLQGGASPGAETSTGTGVSFSHGRDDSNLRRADYVLLSQNGRPLAVIEDRNASVSSNDRREGTCHEKS